MRNVEANFVDARACLLAFKGSRLHWVSALYHSLLRLASLACQPFSFTSLLCHHSCHIAGLCIDVTWIFHGLQPTSM
jgi:hypothetical protein